jgi:hypothetical protein
MIAEPEGDLYKFARCDELILQLPFFMAGHTLCCGGAAVPIDSFMRLGAFDPEAVAAMSKAFDAACEKLSDIDQPEVTREVIAG